MCGVLSSHRQPIRVKWYGVIAYIVSVMEIEDTVCPCAVCIKDNNKDDKKKHSSHVFVCSRPDMVAKKTQKKKHMV